MNEFIKYFKFTSLERIAHQFISITYIYNIIIIRTDNDIAEILIESFFTILQSISYPY